MGPTQACVEISSTLTDCCVACRNRYNDVVLVIMFNMAFPGWLEVQKQLRVAYIPLFRNIVYTGFHHQVSAQGTLYDRYSQQAMQ